MGVLKQLHHYPKLVITFFFFFTASFQIVFFDAIFRTAYWQNSSFFTPVNGKAPQGLQAYEVILMAVSLITHMVMIHAFILMDSEQSLSESY